MSESSQVFLAIIAASTALMALLQIGAFMVLTRVATQMRDIVTTLQQDIRPLISRANAIAEEAQKTATLASAQAQKIDRLVTDLTRRIDETSAVVQQAILAPAREGMALVAALKAGLGALRSVREYRGRDGRVEDEDALFIG